MKKRYVIFSLQFLNLSCMKVIRIKSLFETASCVYRFYSCREVFTWLERFANNVSICRYACNLSLQLFLSSYVRAAKTDDRCVKTLSQLYISVFDLLYIFCFYLYIHALYDYVVRFNISSKLFYNFFFTFVCNYKLFEYNCNYKVIEIYR